MTILLDIDGVMVPATNWKITALQEDGFPDFNEKAVLSLNKIISATNATLLLTTSHKSRFSTDAWKRIFADRGINAKISTLSISGKFQTRRDELLNWLQINKPENGFVIIDDDKSLNDLPAKYRHAVVLTSPLVGLNEETANKAIEVLRGNA